LAVVFVIIKYKRYIIKIVFLECIVIFIFLGSLPMQFAGQSPNQVQESNFVSDLRLVQLEKQLNIELKVNFISKTSNFIICAINNCIFYRSNKELKI